MYFADHELFYWRNGVTWNGQAMPYSTAHTGRRSRCFTMLSRIHKWWRSTVVARFDQLGLLAADRAYWSYGDVTIGDRPEDNPLQISQFPGLAAHQTAFLSAGPYRCDDLSADEHNSHWITAEHLYTDSYSSFVLETLYDAEQSGGAFLTEKTFKAILNAHPFVVFGCAGSLETLRSLGYRTFDSVLDNSYDGIQDNTQRFRATMHTVDQLLAGDMHAWYQACVPDILYNQQLFISSKYNRLAQLNQDLSL